MARLYGEQQVPPPFPAPVNQHLQPEAMIMKTSTQLNLPEQSGTLSRLTFSVLLMGALLAPPARSVDANDGFQYNALFNPTPAQLKAEARGRVMIYDGLDNALVERALDAQFDRIEHMMFIRTRQSSSDDTDDGESHVEDDEDGEGYIEDDGC
jgi:hypothetical protein